MRHVAFGLKVELRVAGDPRREIRRQAKRLVERIGVKRLRVPGRCRACLDTGSGNVVEDVLCRQRPARGLAVRAQHQRFRILRVEMRLHDLGPQNPRRAKLRDLHEIMHAVGEEEGQARRESIDIQPRGDAGPDIFKPVGKRVGQFEIIRRPGLLHVVARHRDEVEFRHVGGAIGEDVRDDPHRGAWRIDVGVADHELLQNVVLDRSGQRLGRHALFLGGDDEQRQNRHHRAVHRHRYRHPVERDITEQQRHVGNGIDGDPGHADIVGNQRIVGIIPAMRRQVEGNGQPHLAGGKVAPVEGVRFLGRREAGILPDCPGPRRIHGGVGAAQKRCDTGKGPRRHRLRRRVGRGQRHDGDAFIGGARRRKVRRLRGTARRQ